MKEKESSGRMREGARRGKLRKTEIANPPLVYSYVLSISFVGRWKIHFLLSVADKNLLAHNNNERVRPVNVM